MQFVSACRSAAVVLAAASFVAAPAVFAQGQGPVLTGKKAFTGYSEEHPGVIRHLTVADLPMPYATKGVDNGAEMVPRPDNVWPQAPQGFKVEQYYTGLDQPRLIRTAPNGDMFVAISYQNKVMVFRGVGADGKPKEVSTFADNLSQPFGIAFYPAGPNPKWVYIGNTDSVVRFPYQNGGYEGARAGGEAGGFAGWRTAARGRALDAGHRVLEGRDNGCSCRVGSHSNDDDSDTHPEEFHRANVLEFTPEGKFVKVYASGIRNCVGEAINPITGRAVVLDERARHAGRQSGAGLHHARAGGRVLRVAVVLHEREQRRALGSAAGGEASGAAEQGDYAGHSAGAAFRFAGDAVLRGIAVSGGIQGRWVCGGARVVEPVEARRVTKWSCCR